MQVWLALCVWRSFQKSEPVLKNSDLERKVFNMKMAKAISSSPGLLLLQCGVCFLVTGKGHCVDSYLSEPIYRAVKGWMHKKECCSFSQPYFCHWKDVTDRLQNLMIFNVEDKVQNLLNSDYSQIYPPHFQVGLGPRKRYMVLGGPGRATAAKPSLNSRMVIPSPGILGRPYSTTDCMVHTAWYDSSLIWNYDENDPNTPEWSCKFMPCPLLLCLCILTF